MTKSTAIAKTGFSRARLISVQSAVADLHSSTNAAVVPAVPRISRPWLTLFTWYARRYVQRHFHLLRVSWAGLPPVALRHPTVIFMNHASWWDPLVNLLLAREFFSDKLIFGPMDAAALDRYAFFKRIGMFGVEQNSRRGAGQFLRTARAILSDANHILWLTPQGRFADTRERPVQFKPGIGHLGDAAERVCFLPLAVEYVFWEERLPEILVRFGPPLETQPDDAARNAAAWSDFLANRLALTQDLLAAEAQQRDPARFRTVLKGRSGVGGIYDWWRGMNARWRGETFQPEHGRL